MSSLTLSLPHVNGIQVKGRFAWGTFPRQRLEQNYGQEKTLTKRLSAALNFN